MSELKGSFLNHTNVVLEAPPGAGKTTLVPLALLTEEWLDGQRIVMLEPRRLAARAAARRMAHLLGERVGETVGYRVRMDTRIGPNTRIEVVTDAILTRFLQHDPSLKGVGLLIFDEYHERSLQVDLGLTLALDAQSIFRPDLHFLVMSATLESGAIADLLGNAPVVVSEGRRYPVETHYLDRRPRAHIEDVVVRTVRKALRETSEGDILVFLPGAGEIRRVAKGLADEGVGGRNAESSTIADVDVLSLHGSLPQKQQDLAISPSAAGHRKVVLSTDIAETSLTIEGVRIVIDSGLTRVPRFSPRSGMTSLVTRSVSKASADQRRGRAGRLGPGICYRLWSRLDEHHLDPHRPPEIVQADLTPLALELALWGISDPLEMRWMDPPPEAAFAQARDLLCELRALDSSGSITDHGRDMAELGLHPRLAHLMLSGVALGLGGLACEIAALLSERDIFRRSTSRQGPSPGSETADLRLRIQALRDLAAPVAGVDPSTARRVSRLADYFRGKLRLADHHTAERHTSERHTSERHTSKSHTSERHTSDRPTPAGHRADRNTSDRYGDIDAVGLLLAFAYPDRIAQMKPGREGHFRLRNGRSAVLREPEAMSSAAFLVAASLDGRGAEGRIFLAAPIAQEDLEEHFSDHVELLERVYWDDGVVRAREQHVLGALVLKDAPLRDPDAEQLADAVCDGIRAGGLDMLPWTPGARRLQERLLFMHALDPDWPDVSDSKLLDTLEDWLRPHLLGVKRLDELQRLDLNRILMERLPWSHHRELDERAPTHIAVPSGSRIPIGYADASSPILRVRIQEMFGLTETPRIDRGRVPLTLHLLSPAHRPVQVTQDLASFWRDTYFEVRKDLRGRYPKHYWPENPLEARPTDRAKPKN